MRASSTKIEVDLVDDREAMAPLHHLRQVVFHIVAQIIEAELVVRAVGDVAGIGGPALVIVEPMHDDTNAEPEEFVDLPHPFGVAAGEIIVHRHDMHALAGERVEVDGERGDERLALARAHLRDAAFVQHHAAHELHVEMALAQGALRRFAHGRESFHEDVVERLARRELVAESPGARGERLVGKAFEILLERIDALDRGNVSLQSPIIGRAEELLRKCAKHAGPFRTSGNISGAA